jgi:hypothetical protein
MFTPLLFTPFLHLRIPFLLNLAGTSLPVKITAFLHGAAHMTKATSRNGTWCRRHSMAIVLGQRWCRGVRDVLGDGVFAAYLCDADVWGLSCLWEGIVAAVEVFALLMVVVSGCTIYRVMAAVVYFEFVLEEVFLVGKFAVETEQSLFVRR